MVHFENLPGGNPHLSGTLKKRDCFLKTISLLNLIMCKVIQFEKVPGLSLSSVGFYLYTRLR